MPEDCVKRMELGVSQNRDRIGLVSCCEVDFGHFECILRWQACEYPGEACGRGDLGGDACSRSLRRRGFWTKERGCPGLFRFLSVLGSEVFGKLSTAYAGTIRDLTATAASARRPSPGDAQCTRLSRGTRHTDTAAWSHISTPPFGVMPASESKNCTLTVESERDTSVAPDW